MEIIQAIQDREFGTERRFLKAKNITAPEMRTTDRMGPSKIKNLNPFVDREGTLRSSTRLMNAETVTFNEKCPAILPGKDGKTQHFIV